METVPPLAAACNLPRLRACRSRRFAVFKGLPRPRTCRSQDLAGTRGLPRQVPGCVLSNLPGKLLLPGPCLFSLYTLFLNGFRGSEEAFGYHPTSLAARCCDCPCTSSGC
jgi:hypothetical protein